MKSKPLHIASPLAGWVALCCGICAISQTLIVRSQVISPEAQRHFQAARDAQNKELYERSAEEYAATIRLAPGFAGAYANLGLVDYVQGNYKDSLAALSKALRLDSTLVGANLYLGIDYVKLSHADEALPYLKRAVHLDPLNKDAQSWLGSALWETGQTRSAIDQFRTTNKNFPNDPDILFVLGEAYRKLADQELQAVIQSASGTAYVHQVFGDIYLDQHALAKAAGHYECALEQDPNAPGIHFELGETALLSGQLERAKAELEKQSGLTPSDAGTMARLGEVELLQGHVVEALASLQRALTLSPLQAVSALHLPPSFATVSESFDEKTLERFRAALPEVERAADSPARDLALATIAATLGQTERLEAAWTRFSSAIPRQSDATDLRGRAKQEFERQRFSEAEADSHAWLVSHPHDLEAQYLAAKSHRLLSLEVLDELLTAHPDSYRSHQLLAQTYEQRDEDEKAIAEYKTVESLAPTLPGIHFALGHILVKDGDLEQATVQLKEELRLDPAQPEANAEMGMALLAQNQPAAAVAFLARAIALQPDLWTAHQELGKAYYLQKDFDSARRQLTLALTDDPEGVAHYQLGMVYRALGQTADADREFASSRKIKADRLTEVRMDKPAGSRND